jgi:hypothetical protein
MKLLPAASLVGAIIVLMFSCQTTPDLSKKYPKMVANMNPIQVGSIEAEFDKMLSSQVSTVEVKAVFHPRLNSVALEFRHDFITYRQFWDEDARKYFADALERYKSDYAERKLVDRYTRSRASYGKTQGQLEWEAFRYTKTRTSHPVIDIGYRFRNKMPFFTTHMRSAKAIDKIDGSETKENSSQVIMYFTRAQADDLVKLFDQSYLMGLIQERVDGSAENRSATVDDYIEYGDF